MVDILFITTSCDIMGKFYPITSHNPAIRSFFKLLSFLNNRFHCFWTSFKVWRNYQKVNDYVTSIHPKIWIMNRPPNNDSWTRRLVLTIFSEACLPAVSIDHWIAFLKGVIASGVPRLPVISSFSRTLTTARIHWQKRSCEITKTLSARKRIEQDCQQWVKVFIVRRRNSVAEGEKGLSSQNQRAIKTKSEQLPSRDQFKVVQMSSEIFYSYTLLFISLHIFNFMSHVESHVSSPEIMHGMFRSGQKHLINDWDKTS